MKKFILFCVFNLFIFAVNAQKSDDPIVYDNAYLISPNYSFQLPLNDMFHSYGFNQNVGLELSYKFGKNWLVSVEGNFMFGGRIKDTTQINHLLTNGSLIGKNGTLEDVNMSMRGMTIMAKFGKIIHFSSKMPNSGLMLKFGIGFIDHKNFIDVNDKNAPQLSASIRTGYDRYTNGIAFSQYIGLIKLEKKQYLNIAFGIEATEGITQNRRPFDFSTGKTFNKTRFDFLIGFKFNWYLPVFMGKTSNAEYYYY